MRRSAHLSLALLGIAASAPAATLAASCNKIVGVNNRNRQYCKLDGYVRENPYDVEGWRAHMCQHCAQDPNCSGTGGNYDPAKAAQEAVAPFFDAIQAAADRAGPDAEMQAIQAQAPRLAEQVASANRDARKPISPAYQQLQQSLARLEPQAEAAERFVDPDPKLQAAADDVGVYLDRDSVPISLKDPVIGGELRPVVVPELKPRQVPKGFWDKVDDMRSAMDDKWKRLEESAGELLDKGGGKLHDALRTGAEGVGRDAAHSMTKAKRATGDVTARLKLLKAKRFQPKGCDPDTGYAGKGCAVAAIRG